MTAPYPEIGQFIRSHADGIFHLLEEMVKTQSGSRNKAGVDRVGRLIRNALADLPLSVESIDQSVVGNHLVVQSPPAADGRKGVLLVGHMDTVFSEASHFNWYREDERHCYGPGVIDMKGGLVVGIAALRALNHLERLDRIPITFIFNADEEIGSVTSSDLIRHHAARSQFAFVLECGGIQGEVVTGRKGNLSATLDVCGEAGHAAFAGSQKASAILAMAHMTIDIEGLNEPQRGISTNVGVIAGGTTPNTIAEHVSARIDARFIEPSVHDELIRKLHAIAASSPVTGVDAKLTIRTSRPPMPASEGNRELFHVIRKTAQSLDMTVSEEFRQGVSDANTIADVGTPVLDGLGPIGANDHSDREYMVKESLVDRSILLACAVEQCWDYFNAKDENDDSAIP